MDTALLEVPVDLLGSETEAGHESAAEGGMGGPMIDHAAVIQDLEAKRDAINATILLLRTVYGMPATNDRQNPQPTTLATKRVYRRKITLPKVPVDSNPARPSPLQDAILKVLKLRPMTSIEAFEAVKATNIQTTAGSVYQTLRLLFEKHLLNKDKNDIGTLTWKVL